MIFLIAELIETISVGITLQPGDIVATGTPFGKYMILNLRAPSYWNQWKFDGPTLSNREFGYNKVFGSFVICID